MGLLDCCNKYFDSTDLYSALGVSQHASEAELKKAYKKLSLLCHPDKVPNDTRKKEEATRKFQVLSKIYCILSDEEKRLQYDETGFIEEDNSELENKDWETYWRLIFPKITKKDIDNYMKEYRGSEQELEDLKKCYIKYEGDMDKISEAFIGYDVREEDKYRHILKTLIRRHIIPDFASFTAEKKSKRNARIKRFKKEEIEAGNVPEKMDLMAMLMQRSADRKRQYDDLMNSLEAKYCYKGEHSEIPENIIQKRKNPKLTKGTKSEEDAKVKKFKKEEGAENEEMDAFTAVTQRSAARKRQFSEMIKRLEAKYCSSKKKQKK